MYHWKYLPDLGFLSLFFNWLTGVKCPFSDDFGKGWYKISHQKKAFLDSTLTLCGTEWYKVHWRWKLFIPNNISWLISPDKCANRMYTILIKLFSLSKLVTITAFFTFGHYVVLKMLSVIHHTHVNKSYRISLEAKIAVPNFRSIVHLTIDKNIKDIKYNTLSNQNFLPKCQISCTYIHRSLTYQNGFNTALQVFLVHKTGS